MECIARNIAKNSAGAEILMDYCAGTLDPAQTTEVEEHLRDCAECRDLVEAQRSLWQTLDAWKPIEVSPGFDDKLYARIAQEQTQPWWSWMWHFSTLSLWKPALSVAAVGALLTVLVIVGVPQKAVIPVAEPSAQVQQSRNAQQSQKIDIQEVQQALDDLDLLTPKQSSPL